MSADGTGMEILPKRSVIQKRTRARCRRNATSTERIERRAEAEKQSEGCGCSNTRQKIIQLRISRVVTD